MSIATAIFSLQAQCNYWPLPVTGSLGRRYRYALFCPLPGWHDGYLQQATGPVKGLGMPDTGSSTDPHRKTLNQIPIALRQSLAPVPHPAVSSLEASQTPAR